jgi:hypothetical protein
MQQNASIRENANDYAVLCPHIQPLEYRDGIFKFRWTHGFRALMLLRPSIG